MLRWPRLWVRFRPAGWPRSILACFYRSRGHRDGRADARRSETWPRARALDVRGCRDRVHGLHRHRHLRHPRNRARVTPPGALRALDTSALGRKPRSAGTAQGLASALHGGGGSPPSCAQTRDRARAQCATNGLQHAARLRPVSGAVGASRRQRRRRRGSPSRRRSENAARRALKPSVGTERRMWQRTCPGGEPTLSWAVCHPTFVKAPPSRPRRADVTLSPCLST